MKIQKFKITIAVPDENDPVKPVDLVVLFAIDLKSSTRKIARLRERRWKNE